METSSPPDEIISTIHQTESQKRSWPYAIALFNYLFGCLCLFFIFSPGIFMIAKSPKSGDDSAFVTSLINVWLLTAPFLSSIAAVGSLGSISSQKLRKTLIYTGAVSVGITVMILSLILANITINFMFMLITMAMPPIYVILPICLIRASKQKPLLSDTAIKITRIAIFTLSIVDIVISIIGILSTI